MTAFTRNIQILTGAKNPAFHALLNQDGTGLFRIHSQDLDVATYSILTSGIDGYIVPFLRKGAYDTTLTDRFSFVVEAVLPGPRQQEDAGAWITVSGRGTLCLLEGPHRLTARVSTVVYHHRGRVRASK